MELILAGFGIHVTDYTGFALNVAVIGTVLIVAGARLILAR